jgi:hypothetical protein
MTGFGECRVVGGIPEESEHTDGDC